jgi:hypothetical protein
MKLVSGILSALILDSSLVAQSAPKPVTVPITLDHNRTIVDVYLPLPDGNTKRVRAWIDTGNPELQITEALATELGLPLSGDPKPTPDGKERTAQAPKELQIGGLSIALESISEAHAVVYRESIAAGCSAEINIPSRILRNYDVLFDYPNRQLTIGQPGSISFNGTSNKAVINPQNGLIQVPSRINGKPYNVAFDVGSNISLLSAMLITKWQMDNPRWPHMVGAVGRANMWGADTEPRWDLLRIPTIQYGSTPLRGVVVASFPDPFLKWFETRAGSPTIGLIGTNAFLDYRVGIDYAHSVLYLQRTNPKPASDMDVVGLVLRPERDNRYRIIGVADYHGKPSVPEAKVGDLLLGVDGAPATGATMGQVWSLLGGAPGQTRSLTLERDGKHFTVNATVHRFLSEAPKKNKRP